MNIVARIDGTDYEVRSISGNGRDVFTNFADTPPSALLAMIGDNQTHTIVAVIDGTEREEWVVTGGGHHTDYTSEEIAAFVSWQIVTHRVL